MGKKEKWYTVTFEISEANLNEMVDDGATRRTIDQVREIIYCNMPAKIAIINIKEG